jgi:hypothetical protein
MIELLGKLLDRIDPVLAAVIISFVLTIFVLWRFFGKQHEFFREQADTWKQDASLWKQDNEELRKQIQFFRGEIQLFKEENDRLRKASSMLVVAVEQIQAQPLLGEQQIEELRMIAETAKRAVLENLPVTNEVVKSSIRIFEAVQEINRMNEISLSIQKEGFGKLENAIRESASNQDVIAITQQLIHLIGENQRGLADRIMELDQQARELSSKSR